MENTNINEIIILLAAAVFIVTVFKLLNLSPVLGYLAAGSAIGPHGFKIITDAESTHHIAEFGVVFLLFAIGLELTFDRLKSMRMHVFGLGTAQVIITASIIGYFAFLLGIDTAGAIIIGVGLSLSSTAIVLQILAERGEEATQMGRLSLSVLILQDLAVAPLLIMVTLLAKENVELSSVISDALIKAAVAIMLIFTVGSMLLRPLYRLIASAQSQELFIATTLFIVLGSSFFTEWAGLSLALGAFAAGLLVAETEFRPQVEADILPFKGLLMGLFFMTVGMKIDYHIISENSYQLLFLTCMLIIIKSSVVMLLSRLFGFRRGCSIQAGFLLAQGSEFAFVLFGLAAKEGVMDEEITQIIMVVITLSMALTPMMLVMAKKIVRRLELKNPVHLDIGDITKETIDLDGHIIVAGFGRLGRTICELLASENINYVALDDNPTNVHKGRKNGYPVFYGNADRMDILKSLGIERAELVAITLDNEMESNKIVTAISGTFPFLPIIARAKDRRHAKELRHAGATVALAEMFESSLMIGGSILQFTGISDNEVRRVIEQFREKEYPISSRKNILHTNIMRSVKKNQIINKSDSSDDD